MTKAESKQGRIFFLALILRSSKKQLLGGDLAVAPRTPSTYKNLWITSGKPVVVGVTMVFDY
jgi:hypothetical protein